MNSNVMPSRVQMEPSLLQQLVAEVKETVATGIEMPQPATASSFKAINLWNVRRKSRYTSNAVSRRKNVFLSVTHVSF